MPILKNSPLFPVWSVTTLRAGSEYSATKERFGKRGGVVTSLERESASTRRHRGGD